MSKPEAVLLDSLRAALTHYQREQAEPAAQLERSLTQIELERSLETVEACRVISSHWPLAWHNLPTRFWSGVNRLVRRYLRWYIDPIAEQQTAFNTAVAHMLAALAAAQADLRTQQAAIAYALPRTLPAPLVSGDDGFVALTALVAERAAAEPKADFPELALPPLLAIAEGRREVQAHWELLASTPYQRALVTVHKLVRCYLRWLVNPIVEQQNASNAAVCQTLATLIARDAEVRALVAAQRAAQARAATNDTDGRS